MRGNGRQLTKLLLEICLGVGDSDGQGAAVLRLGPSASSALCCAGGGKDRYGNASPICDGRGRKTLQTAIRTSKRTISCEEGRAFWFLHEILATIGSSKQAVPAGYAVRAVEASALARRAFPPDSTERTQTITWCSSMQRL